MIDKEKLIDFLKQEIESCKALGNASDQSIIWECEKILDRINSGVFNK